MDEFHDCSRSPKAAKKQAKRQNKKKSVSSAIIQVEQKPIEDVEMIDSAQERNQTEKKHKVAKESHHLPGTAGYRCTAVSVVALCNDGSVVSRLQAKLHEMQSQRQKKRDRWWRKFLLPKVLEA